MAKNFFSNEEPLTPSPATSEAFKSDFYHKLKKWGLIPLILLFCIIAIVFFFFKVLNKNKSYTTISENNSQATTNKTAAIATNNYIELQPIIANLLYTNSKQSYLKLTLTIQLSSDKDIILVEEKTPVVIDTLQTFASGLRASDLTGTGNIILLKEELIKRINKVVYPVVISDVLVKEMIIN